MTLDNDLLWIRLVITTCDNQPEGKGVLRLEDGTILLPNDLYPLEKEKFRLYYKSLSTDQQVIDVYIVDSHGQMIQKTFSFNSESQEKEESDE